MAKQINVQRRQRALDMAARIQADPDVYRYLPASFKQTRALGFMVERASRRKWSLDPAIPLSQLDISCLFDVFKAEPGTYTVGAKVGMARTLKALSDSIKREQRAGTPDPEHCFLLDAERAEFTRCKPTDHPLYVSPDDKRRAKLNATLDDDWDDWDRAERERVEHQAKVDDFLTGGDDYQWTDDDLNAEINDLEAELADIECPYEQQATADRMAALCAQLEVTA